MKSIAREIIQISCCVTFVAIGAFLLFDFLFPFEVNISYSQTIYAKDSTLLYGFLSSDEKWRIKTENQDVTPELRTAFLAKEDQYFAYHFGINPIAIFRALGNNLKTGKRTSGASTITMQVARLLEPKPRTYPNKLWEMIRAFQLEWHYSKEDIFSMYLNLVPYGGNIEGIKAASLLFFGTTPSKLSVAQIVTLAIVPNRPTSLALGKRNAHIKKSRDKWLRIFKRKKVFDQKKIEVALQEPLHAYRHEMPKYAPHLAFELRKNYPHQGVVRTTISSDIQAKVEKITKNYAMFTRRMDIHNSAVLVIDNATRNILAYVGSPDFSDVKHSGQVNGIKAVRSPGSTLKPMIYGLSFDAGLATPKYILHDIPTNFMGYEPENYNKKFNGKVTVEKSLALSLNVPAVRMLDRLGVTKMIRTLEQLQFESIRKNQDKLGLSLALGGCGVSLWELAGMYACFANQGVYEPLQMIRKESIKSLQSIIFSPEANFMVTDILTKVQRPDLPSDYEHNPNVPKIAWKTGTSYGRRDAWSIGFNHRYTIAVWVGNFDGHGSPELTGAGVATPLLFRLFNTIDYNSDRSWFGKPPKLQTRQVCTESGLVVSDLCQHATKDLFIPNISNIKKCESRKYIFVNLDETQSYASDCLPEAGNYKKKVYPNISPELEQFYNSNQIIYEKIPPQAPNCSEARKNNAPKITSPVAGSEYYQIDSENIELSLSCLAANDVEHVYWYINNKLLQATQKHQNVFFRPSRGKIKISCSDDQGRNTNISITVK